MIPIAFTRNMQKVDILFKTISEKKCFNVYEIEFSTDSSIHIHHYGN